jgi:hypothetical protein
LEDGVWFNGSGDVYIEGPRDMQGIKALIPLTRWGLDEYRLKPAEGDEDAEFVGTTSYVAEGMFANLYRPIPIPPVIHFLSGILMRAVGCFGSDESIGMWGIGIRIYSGPLRVAAPVEQVVEGGISPDDEDKGETDSIDLLYPLPTGRV